MNSLANSRRSAESVGEKRLEENPMEKYPVYKATISKGQIAQILLVGEQTKDEFRSQHYNETVEERDRVLLQTVLSTEEAIDGEGVVFYMMHPGHGVFLKEEFVSARRLKLHYWRKRTKHNE